MYLKYEGADFKVGLRSGSMERHLIKQSIKKRIGKLIGKPYQLDSYLKFASKLLSRSPDGIIVDIGANIGTTVLPLAIKFSSAKFYAIEPHPVPAARFIENCERNREKARRADNSWSEGKEIENQDTYTSSQTRK